MRIERIGEATLYTADVLEALRSMADESVHCVMTSPPYWGLRDYGQAGQIGLEPTPEAYVTRMVEVFDEVRRVLRGDGVMFLNLGDAYGGTRPSRSPANVLAYDTDGKELQDFQEPDSSCFDLCDECRAALGLSRTENNDQQRPQSRQLGMQKVHGSESSDSFSASQDVSLHDVQGSTSGESVQQPRDGCLHCANCGACLNVLSSATRDASLCARRGKYKDGNGRPLSDDRKQNKDALGMAWFNYKPKDLIGLPWLVALALRADGWYLRSDIIWAKPNPMPESVTDRPTKAHEYLFLLSKSPRYFYDAEAIKEPAEYRTDERPFGDAGGNRHGDEKSLYRPRQSVERGGFDGKTNALPGREAFRAITQTRNRRTVWTIATQPYPEAHFATFPEKLVEPCVLAGCPAQVCPECGAPWERETEREFTPTSDKRNGEGKKGMVDSNSWGDFPRGHTNTRTLGFRPTCAHDRTPVPGTFLDPFCGAGTALLVALRLGRRAVGIELKPEYMALTRKRIEAEAAQVKMCL